MAHEAQERYSKLVLARLRKELVLADGVVFNNDYEGDPTAGAVKIPVRDKEVSARDYDKAKGTSPESGTTTYKTIPITKDVIVNEIIDGYDAEAVPDNLVADRLDSAGYSLANRIDDDGATALIEGSTHVSVEGVSPINVYDIVVDLRTKMSKANVPLKDKKRYLLATPDFQAHLLRNENFISASALGDAVKQEGVIGRIAGFNVYEWNDDTAGLQCIAGHPRFATRVQEFTAEPEIVSLKGDAKYVKASAVKGRVVFDHAVLRKSAVYSVFAPALIELVQSAFSSGKVTLATAETATDSFVYRVNPTKRATYEEDFSALKETNAWTSGSEIAAKKGDTVEIIDLNAEGKCVAVGYMKVE
ncbi:MAG: hypothetical protein IJ496_09565 [Ruminococcus sp.]|nr:hypothetical protein [Ruminococcus sp.]